jgi:hypothetical protein
VVKVRVEEMAVAGPVVTAKVAEASEAAARAAVRVTEVAGPAAAARAAVGTEAEAKAAEAWVEAERVVVARAAVATVA